MNDEITVKWISYDEAEKLDESKCLGGMGGWFSDGDRWEDFLECFNESIHPQLEAIRKSVIKNDIWRGGEWSQDSKEGIPITSGGYYYQSTYRNWGDLMGAIWSTHHNKDYEYINFYMESWLHPNPSGKKNKKWKSRHYDELQD